VHGLARIPTSKLREELDRRRESAGEIHRQRQEIAAQLEEIDRTLRDLGEEPSGAPRRRGPGRPPGSGAKRGPGRPRGSGAKRRPGRPPGSGAKRGPGRPPGSGAKKVAGRPGGSGRRARNEMNLVDALSLTLKGKTMGVSEVADAVQRDGYKTTSPNFRTIVNQALLSNSKVFKKVSRGQYTAK
jgi:hypothetical protein